jgi:hypothetical protein
MISTCLFLITQAHAQVNVEKTVPIKAGQTLRMVLDRADVVLHTWDKNEILVRGTVSINKGENDSAFELVVEPSAEGVIITDVLKDEESIPKRVTIKSGDKEYTFRASSYDDPEVQKFLEANRQYSYMSLGIDIDISLEFFIPKNTTTFVEAKYGAVEMKNFDAALSVDAKFGMIDATIIKQTTGELVARARFGEILSNLDLKFNEGEFPQRGKGNQWTEISVKPGKGPAYRFESKFGNVYLRKPQ